jgi:hypothetical protein
MSNPLRFNASHTSGANWGCKPKPPKFPSGQIERRHDGIEVDELPAVTKGGLGTH